MRTRIISRLLLFQTSVALVSAQSLGVFSNVDQLTTPRTGPTATLLTDGKVLVAGGWATLAGSPVWSSAELYDPSTTSFTLTGGMAVPRYAHTATLLPNGMVLIAGGSSVINSNSSNLGLASAELYDPSTGTFTPTGSMMTGRYFHTATLLNNGKVLITGGDTSNASGNQLASTELYDPLTGTFSAAGNMTAPRDNHFAVLLADGRVLIEGGLGGFCLDPPNPEVYDPVTGAFTPTGGSTNPGLTPMTATLLPDGTVYTTMNVPCDVGNGAESYNPATGAFAPATTLPAASVGFTATQLPNGQIFLHGTLYVNYQAGGSSLLYDPPAAAYATLSGAFPESGEGHTSTLLADGTVLLAGGWICCGFSVANAEVYAPAVLVPSPRLYSLSGATQGAIWNSATGQVASPQTPASSGQVLSMYTNGLIEGGVIPPQVSLGGQLAEILYFGDAPGYPGYFQVNFRVPAGVTPGPAIPVRLTYLNRPSNEVSIAAQ
jgi:hypothetical protein